MENKPQGAKRMTQTLAASGLSLEELQEHAGKYIAVDGEAVVASAATLVDLKLALANDGYQPGQYAVTSVPSLTH